MKLEMKPKDKRRKNDSPQQLGKQAAQTSEADPKGFRNMSEDLGSEKVTSSRMPLIEESFAGGISRLVKKDTATKVASQIVQFEDSDKAHRKPFHTRPQEPPDPQEANSLFLKEHSEFPDQFKTSPVQQVLRSHSYSRSKADPQSNRKQPSTFQVIEQSQQQSVCLTSREPQPLQPLQRGAQSRSPRLSQSSGRADELKLLSSQKETFENTSNSLVSAKQTLFQKEKPIFSKHQSSSVDYGLYDEDDYKSMWADISQNTIGEPKQLESETDYSGIFQQTQMRSSHYGTLDLNESFQCSASQASLNMWNQDCSFVEDSEGYSEHCRRTPTGSFLSQQKPHKPINKVKAFQEESKAELQPVPLPGEPILSTSSLPFQAPTNPAKQGNEKGNINFVPTHPSQVRQRASYTQSMQPSTRIAPPNNLNTHITSFNLYPQPAFYPQQALPVSPTHPQQAQLLQQRLLQLNQMQALGQLGIHDKVYQQYLSDFEQITDKNLRIQAQQHFIQEMQRLYQPQPVPSRRDSSLSSSVSKSSNTSSNSMSSHSSQMKANMAAALQTFNLLQTENDRRKFLIEKSYLFARDKFGCQILQKKITEEVQLQMATMRQTPSQFTEDLISELLGKPFYKLMMHPLANFLCQMLVPQASRQQLELMLANIKEEFCKLSMDQHGTRALQSLMDECIKRQKTIKKNASVSKLLTEALDKGNRTLEMMMHVRGNHVVKQTLALLSQVQRQKQIYQIALQNFEVLTTDKNGCQVVQECLLTANQEQRRKLVQCCYKNIQSLINHEFGNYVVQQVLSTVDDEDMSIKSIYDFIAHNLAQLSKEQYGSRVVDHAVLTMPCPAFEQLCVNFIDFKSKRSRLYKELLFDPYGNYIAAKLIEKAKCYGLAKMFDHFSKTFNDSIEGLKKCRHGRQLISKIEAIQLGHRGATSSSSSSKLSNQMSQSSIQ